MLEFYFLQVGETAMFKVTSSEIPVQGTYLVSAWVFIFLDAFTFDHRTHIFQEQGPRL